MKVVGYETGKSHTTDIVRAMLKPANGTLLSINDYLDEGLADADLIIIAGILRGPGLIYKECVKKNRNFLYLDHAYFNKGYNHPTWMRVSRNRHTFGPSLVSSDGTRFNKYFSNQTLEAWKQKTDGDILVLPPTNAICWLFEQHDWEKQIVDEVKKYTDKRIKVRAKPQNPIVNDKGYLIRMEENDSKDVPLVEDLRNAYAVVTFNSNSVIEATRYGVPIICSEHCAAYPIAKQITELESGNFLIEPNRQQLFYNLADNQYTKEELASGVWLTNPLLTQGI